MKNRKITEFAKKHVAMAVVIDFKDEGSDWHHYRIERVRGSKIALTGMTDENGCKHIGDFFWVEASDIKEIRLRE